MMLDYSIRRKLIVRKIFILVTIVGLYIFNANQSAIPSSAQLEYDRWLAAVVIDTDMSLSVTVKSSDGEYALDSKSSARYKLLRILELMREARLFDNPEQDEKNTFEIEVRGGQKTFTVSLHPSQIQNNLQARLMLKLLSEYRTDAKS